MPPRAARWRDLLPSFALVLTQALWFAVPFWVHYWGWHTGLAPLDAQTTIANYTVMIFLGHGIQYLWITTYYARAGGQWHGYASYWAKAVAAGLAIWTLPALLIHPFGFRGRPDLAVGTLALVGTFINLHHFILDGAIWKLRNTRIAAVLIRNAPEPSGGEPAPRSPWLRRIVWGTAGAAVVAGFAGFGLTRFFAPAALARGELERAQLGLDVGAWLGSEDPLLRVAIAEAMVSRGDKERAAALLERLVVAYPAGTTYALLGRVEAMRGKADAARAAFETALAKNVPRADRVHAALASLALKRGDEVAASEHYRSAIALHPSATSVANDFAWLLATARDPAVRDAKTAVEVAEQLVKMNESPNHFDTLAAAYAAAGRWDDAVRAASRAAELAEQQRDSVLLADIHRNLDRYRARQTAAQ